MPRKNPMPYFQDELNLNASPAKRSENLDAVANAKAAEAIRAENIATDAEGRAIFLRQEAIRLGEEATQARNKTFGVWPG